MPLYIFKGYPNCGLNAGGLQHAVEEVEELAILEHDGHVQYTKEGVALLGTSGKEIIGPVEGQFSPTVVAMGVTWDWFPENWAFGNGTTVHKTTAMREKELVDHGTGRSLPELLATGEPVTLANLTLQLRARRTEGWEKYEARWLPGTCPQDSHVVHLTWLVTKHRLPEFAYMRIWELIENPAVVLKDRERYEPKHFSPERVWKPARPKLPALAGGYS